jgi:signal transduction histidine kinase
MADPDRLRQVIDNLLSNAIKSSPPEAPIEIQASRQDERLRLAIVDQGPGIPVDEQPLLFRRFARPSGVSAGGVGLGLYLTRELMTLLHGQVGVDSAPGCGATFWISLPLAAA